MKLCTNTLSRSYHIYRDNTDAWFNCYSCIYYIQSTDNKVYDSSRKALLLNIFHLICCWGNQLALLSIGYSLIVWNYFWKLFVYKYSNKSEDVYVSNHATRKSAIKLMDFTLNSQRNKCRFAYIPIKTKTNVPSDNEPISPIAFGCQTERQNICSILTAVHYISHKNNLSAIWSWSKTLRLRRANRVFSWEIQFTVIKIVQINYFHFNSWKSQGLHSRNLISTSSEKFVLTENAVEIVWKVSFFWLQKDFNVSCVNLRYK